MLAWFKHVSMLFNLFLGEAVVAFLGASAMEFRSVALLHADMSNSSRPRKTVGGVLDWNSGEARVASTDVDARAWCRRRGSERDLLNRSHLPRPSSVIRVHPSGAARKYCFSDLHRRAIRNVVRYPWADIRKVKQCNLWKDRNPFRRLPIRDVHVHHAIPTRKVPKEEVD